MSVPLDLHNQIKTAVISKITSLSLAAIGNRVYGRMFFDEAIAAYPCVAVTIEGETERFLPGDTLNQEKSYPVRIWLVDRIPPNAFEKEPGLLLSRKTIIDAFHQKRLADVPYVYKGQIDPRPIILTGIKSANDSYELLATGMVAQFFTWEPRS